MPGIEVNLINTQGRPRDVSLVAAVNPDGALIGGSASLEFQSLTEGMAYLASVGGVDLTAGQEICMTIANPPGSGRDIFLTNRLFSAFADVNDRLEYIAYSNPTAVLTTLGTTVNRDLSQQVATPSVAVFRYQVAAQGSIIMGGTVGSSTPIPRDGAVDPRRLLVSIPPGFSLGFSARGAGATLQNAARVFASLEWFEAP